MPSIFNDLLEPLWGTLVNASLQIAILSLVAMLACGSFVKALQPPPSMALLSSRRLPIAPDPKQPVSNRFKLLEGVV